MGCGSAKIINNKAIKLSKSNIIKINSNKPNLSENILYGYLEGNFRDCLITNDKELEEKLINFIPTKIPNDNNPNELVHNVLDDIITQSVEFNFDKNNIIALRGINKILKVEECNGNYLVFQNERKEISSKYIAIIVKKLNGNPQIKFAQ